MSVAAAGVGAGSVAVVAARCPDLPAPRAWAPGVAESRLLGVLPALL